MKKWYNSKTIWGIVAAAIVSLTGYGVSENELSSIAVKVAEVASLIFALYGRITAKEIIK
jgi:hypothetical protein